MVFQRETPHNEWRTQSWQPISTRRIGTEADPEVILYLVRGFESWTRQALRVLWHGSLLVWFWVLFLLSEELAMLFIDKKILHHHCWTEVRALDWISGGREEWEALIIHRWKQPENIFPLAQCPWCNLPRISSSDVWLVPCISYWDRLHKSHSRPQ